MKSIKLILKIACIIAVCPLILTDAFAQASWQIENTASCDVQYYVEDDCNSRCAQGVVQSGQTASGTCQGSQQIVVVHIQRVGFPFSPLDSAGPECPPGACTCFSNLIAPCDAEIEHVSGNKYKVVEN